MSRQHTLTLNSAFAAPAPAAVREKTIAALKMIAAGCGIAVLQVLLIPLVRHIGLAQAQMTLFQWDSGWYANVAKYGYHFGYAPAFFPGYPVLINAVRDLTGLSLVSSMLLISQSFAALFWTYVVALLVRLRVPTAGRWVVVALLLAHPGAFFQVAAYSESLFLANMLGFVYWNLEHRRA